MKWEEYIGEKVIFTGKIKKLNEGTIGILSAVFGDKCSIVYPQNAAFDENCKPIKNSPNQVYAHSALLTEIKLVDTQ